jgi:hypothetical protein
MNWHWETRHLTWSCEAIEGVKTRGGLKPFLCGYLAAGDGQRELAVEILVIIFFGVCANWTCCLGLLLLVEV